MDTHDGLVEHLPQLTQLVATLRLEGDRHVASRHLVHDLAKGLQGRARGHVETAVEVDDQQEHHHQRDHQQHHLRAVLGQALAQLAIEKGQQAIVERVGPGHLLADLLVKLGPGRIETVGDDHLVLEQHTAVLQALPTGLGQTAQAILRGDAARQRLLQVQAIFGVQLLQLQQQIIELGAGCRVEKALPQRVGADGAALAQHVGDLRGDVGDQLGDLANLALRVLAETGLAGHQLDEHLRGAEQLLDDDRLALQRRLAFRALEIRQQLVALADELGRLLGVLGDRLQALQPRAQRLLQLADAAFQIARLAGLADHRVDLHQVIEAFQVTPQLQALAQ